MQIKVDDVYDKRETQYGVSYKLKAGNDSYYCNDAQSETYKGQTLEIEVTNKTGKNGPYKVAKVLKVLNYADQHSNGNGRVEQSKTKPGWEGYKELIAQAHKMAVELEPDSPGDGATIYIDRSRTRAALVSTILIAHQKGDFEFFTDETDAPF